VPGGIPAEIDYRPVFPQHYRPQIGIIGAGNIVRRSHLPAYAKYGVDVGAIYDIREDAALAVASEFAVGRVARDLDDVLSDPAIDVVDIATFPEQRAPLIRRALQAGKHVLSQKPFALDMATAQSLVAEAEHSGRLLAVNQNGRWSPAWRGASDLIERGVIGDLISVTHMLDRSFRWTIGSHYEHVAHLVLYDYSIHWIDICRTWFGNRAPKEVRARECRSPNQPAESVASWGLTVEIDFEDGAHALIRSTGGEPAESDGHPFLINGTEGKIRGSSLGNDFLEVERGGPAHRYELDTAWFPDGFAGTMGELFSAIAEGRQPSNSARHNLRSLQLTLAACESAEQNGAPITLQLPD
jgi:predicted dehydrogenase